MAIKGRIALNKAITAQLAPFGITKCFLGTDYSYYYDNNDISFKLTLTYEDELFSEFIKERFNYDDTGLEFLISLLHEVGHAMTGDLVEDYLYEFCLAEKNRICKDMEKATTDEEVRKLEWQYFTLPDEIIATAWAIDYAKAHPLEIGVMWAYMKEALAKFYKVNEVTGD